VVEAHHSYRWAAEAEVRQHQRREQETVSDHHKLPGHLERLTEHSTAADTRPHSLHSHHIERRDHQLGPERIERCSKR